MKKKILALLLALSMVVSLVSPAFATGENEGIGEPTPAETVQTLLETLLDLYEKNDPADAGSILAVLAKEENAVLPEGCTLPDLTDSLNTKLSDLLTEDQVKALQDLLDQEAQAKKQESNLIEQIVETLTGGETVKAAADWTLQDLFNDLAARHAAVTDGNYEEQTGLLTGLTQEAKVQEQVSETPSQETTEEVTPEETAETQEPVLCTVCGEENCGETHVRCDICQGYDCEIEHLYCDQCEKYDCGLTHAFCTVCQAYDCGLTHVYCAVCQTYDCGLTHEGTPEPDLGEEPAVCETCGSDPCTCGPVVVCEECGGQSGQHEKTCSQYVKTCTCTPIGDVHMAGCDFYVAPVTLYDQIMAGDSVEEMYIAMLDSMYDRPEALKALTAEEINAIRERVNELDPEGDDGDTADLLDTLAILPNGGEALEGEPEILAPNDFKTAYDNIIGGTDSKSMSGEYVLNGDIYIDKIVYVKDGETLKITGSGTIRRTGHSQTHGFDMFQLGPKSKLIIGEKNVNSGAKDTIVLDGGINSIARRPLIMAYQGGDVELYHVTLKSNRNRGTAATEANKLRGSPFPGGAIYIAPSYVKDSAGNYVKDAAGNNILDYTPSLTLYSCSIMDCVSYSVGGGIRSEGCNINLENSEILRCNAVSNAALQTNGERTATVGAGGGIYMIGLPAYSLKPTCTFTNSNVSYNQAVGYGGGIEIRNGAQLVMHSGSMNYNKSLNRGAGALHVTGDASFTMNGGEMVGNVCYEVGGAIHTSYTCVLNLNGGEIKDNIAYGRGGGVHVDVGGDLVLNGTDIINNHAYDEVTLNGVHHTNIGVSNIVGGVYVDELGNILGDPVWWGNAAFRGEAGYGGGVLIDCGTCTLNRGTISGNTAAVGGGGLCFVMLLISTDDRFGQTGVCGFEMNGGTIAGNHSDGDGGGVYLMRNVLTVENVATATGLTYTIDSDGGITFYKDGKKMVMTKSDGTELTPLDLKALFDAIPVVEIKGGTIVNNTAADNGGGIYQEENTKFVIRNTGNLSGNEATNGGGVYVASGTAEIHGGTMSANSAKETGGALYISGDVTITNGTIGGSAATNGNIAVNGGAAYVTDGMITMSGGTIQNNTATANGGALYANGGNVTIAHGALNSNSAVQGGAVYMAGGTAVLTMESGEMKSNTAGDDGGAIYATGGTIKIGLASCEGPKTDAEGNVDANNGLHTNLGAGRHHPEIQNNESKDCGGGIALTGAGTISFYCGDLTDNTAKYQGVGKNVFMQGGVFNLYEGADVGIPGNPDLVIVGGTLNNMSSTATQIKLKYYKNNTDTTTEMEGSAELGEYMNLPDGEYFWDAPAGTRFFGWTAKGGGNETQLNVRNKNQYLPSGAPVKIVDTQDEGEPQKTWDGTADSEMNLYALWAPLVNGITVVDGMTNQQVTISTVTTYEIKDTEQTVSVPAIEKAGYRIVGWYIYQNEGKNANWGDEYEPVYLEGKPETYENLNYAAMDDQYIDAEADGSLSLEVPLLTFGDITLIAKFVPATSTLEIVKTGCTDETQSFVFHINGTRADGKGTVDMDVTIQGNGSETISNLPVGEYTITEDTEWSWRYRVESIAVNRETVSLAAADAANQKTVPLSSPTEKVVVTFNNKLNNEKWLTGCGIAENQWRTVVSDAVESILDLLTG